MSGLDAAVRGEERSDPFALPAPGRPPGRPRLLSYVGRWGRARRWLPPEALRVLDVGCAFGYGSAAIVANGPQARTIVGVERDPKLLAQAARRFPWLRMVDADAAELPVADDCADAVLLLEVIEHVSEPERVLREVRRALRPGGTLIVTVPHRGATRGIDAVNLYSAVRRRRPSLPELEGLVGTDEGEHHHFSVTELRGLLEPDFTVERIARTGLGLQELVTLTILSLRVALHAPRLARLVMPLHLVLNILDDLLPTGPFAYNLAVCAHSNKPAGGSTQGAGNPA